MTVSRAVVCLAPGEVEVREVELPTPDPGEVLIKTAFSAISPGTEIRCVRGEQPDSAPFPFVPGYSMVGEVVGGEPEWLGKTVYCGGGQRFSIDRMWGGHCGHAVAKTDGLCEVPAGLSLADASMARLLAIALRGVSVATPTIGERVAVIGLGVIGLFSARAFAAAGADVLALDQSPDRAQIAGLTGIRTAVVERNLPEPVLALWPDGADIVVDSTGVRVVLDHAIACGRERTWDDHEEQGCRIVLQGSYPGDAHFNYQSAFLKEASLLLPRDCQPHDIKLALEMMADARVSTLGIRDIQPAESAPEIYHSLLEGHREPPTCVLAW